MPGSRRQVRRTSGQILFVREYQQQALLHLTITQYTMELLLRLVYALAVLAVDNEDETLGASVVVPPQRPDLVLSSDIPHVELDVLVCHRLHVKTDCTSRNISVNLRPMLCSSTMNTHL